MLTCKLCLFQDCKYPFHVGVDIKSKCRGRESGVGDQITFLPSSDPAGSRITLPVPRATMGLNSLSDIVVNTFTKMYKIKTKMLVQVSLSLSLGFTFLLFANSDLEGSRSELAKSAILILIEIKIIGISGKIFFNLVYHCMLFLLCQPLTYLP